MKLGLDIQTEEKDEIFVGSFIDDSFPYGEDAGSDAYAATRRAIVRAAAEIGRAMS